MAIPLRAALWALIVGTLACPVAASAAGPVVPIEVAPIKPANGEVYQQRSGFTRVPFTARWTAPPSATSLFVEVTTTNVTGQDGTLADDEQYSAGRGSLGHGDADPSLWTGELISAFPSTPGTYFFQFHAPAANSDCGPIGGICTLASPVFSLRVRADQASVWSAADATSEVRGVIKDATRRTPVNLHRSCARLSKLRFRCRADWRDTKWLWRGTFLLRLDTAASEVVYTFRGRRASHACVRTRSVKRCQRSASF